ncbi:ATP-binding protein [Algoriphagus sp.]|uniref:ATP-binding protein n=1 Tax=Algoriphagus sp. TaxID=1872435 RepID=UPI002609C3CA|nr:ATP-binding protein [Algoriphagus sp.]
MVFLADDTFPYNIFYGNEAFEEQIGQGLNERTLLGLGLDINAYIFKEELILTHAGKDYGFRLELPTDHSSNYYLFYKGKELRMHGLPPKKEVQQFFKSSLDLIAVGQHDYLTYVNHASLPILGYDPAFLQNTSLCSFIHEDDLERIRPIWKSKGGADQLGFFRIRFIDKQGVYKFLDCSVQFTEDRFFILARDVSQKAKHELNLERRKELMKNVGSLGKMVSWEYFEASQEFLWDDSTFDFFEKESQKELERQILEKLKNKNRQEQDVDLEFGSESLKGTAQLISSAGNSAVWVGVVWDEGPRKALESKSLLHERLILNAPEPIIISKGDGQIYLCNSESKKLFGLGKNQNFSHLKDIEPLLTSNQEWRSWIQTAINGENITHFSSELLSQSGQTHAIEIAASRLVEEGENYVFLSFRNVSEKVSLEKTLEENSNFLMNLTEQVPGGLYQLVLDGSGKMNFSFLSKGIAAVLGLKQEELSGFSDISMAISRVHPLDLPQLIMSSVASAKKLEPWQCQFRVKSSSEPSGYRWILGAARPQSLDNGDMVWYGYLTDISQQKEFETKLDEARKTAEKASQIKSDFLSMISHELRTPLNAISGSVYSLLQETPTDQQMGALNTINFAVDNLIIMINDLLDFQKIEAGKLTIEKAPFNLKDLVEQVIKGLSFHAKDSKNNLNLHLFGGLDVQVKGDKTRLSQVLNNLITNALKFTKEGNVDVTAKLKAQSSDKISIYFEVKDTGIGIAPEHQERIFNDFDQVKPTFSAKYGGTGLGLSITRKLLNLMGGAIGLESAEGVGSTFYFELTFDLVKTATTNGTIKEFSHAMDLSSLHLLMAEDNDVNALVLGKIIKKWGYTFERVINGQEAVEAMKTKTFDCVLMDIQMPVMDGFEATKAIKKFSKTPVLALTAAAKLEIMEQIEACGFEGFVAKPIDAAELLKKIREVIHQKNQRA